VSAYALKFCTDATAAKVLRNEAALLGRVMSEGKHQGIVKLLHTYLNAETPRLEYEYVAGGDLTKVIAQWHRSPSASTVEQATKLVYRLAEIVAYAHKLNPPIVHRDLKPANILLYRTDRGRYAPCVADFGIGGVVAGQALAAAKRSRVGCNLLPTALRGAHTPLYASPQQIDGKPPDPRDDVHALGVIWYQLLTGDMNIVSLPADWQDEVRSRGVSEDLLALLTSCLASRAEKRPGDAVELARRISEIQTAPGHQLILPPPTDSTHKRPQPSNDHNSQVDQTSPSSLAPPDPRRNEWFYTLYGVPAPAPVSAAQLKHLAASGQLKPTDLVWQDGMLEWAPANSVKGLFPAAVPCSAPAVQPVPAAPVPCWVESLKQVEDVRDSHTARQAIVQSGGDEESRRRDAGLRPRWLREMIGQHAIVQRLSIVLNGCKKLKEPLAHILFEGPPGMARPPSLTHWPTNWARRSK
jgi:serine/threonine protein kinase